MYLTIVQHKTLRRGTKLRFSLCFCRSIGGFPYARGGTYSSVETCQAYAARLAGYELPWSLGYAEGEATRCHVELLLTPTLYNEVPAVEWKPAQEPPAAGGPLSPTREDPSAQGRADYAAGTCQGPRKEDPRV